MMVLYKKNSYWSKIFYKPKFGRKVLQDVWG